MKSNKPAASPWRSDPPPKDGRRILALFHGVHGARCVVDWGKKGWYAGFHLRGPSDPTHWAEIIMPAAQAEEENHKEIER